MEFTVKYDERVLSAAAPAIFHNRWRPFFPWPALGLTTLSLLIGAIDLLIGGPIQIATIFLSLGLLSVGAWLVLFALLRVQIMKRSGEIARVLIGEKIVRVESVKGVAEVPWSAVTEIEIGLANVLIFIARGIAIILPTASVPSAAIEIIERMRPKKTSS